MAELMEAVPNISEGTRRDVIANVADAAARSRAHVLDTHSDAAHNRTVISAAGLRRALVEGMLAAITVAVEKIDLRSHAGVHPRVGVADVVPLVPLGDTPMRSCVEAAQELAEKTWVSTRVPVFLYGLASTPPQRSLADIRAGRVKPDLGDLAHASAGAVCIGARNPLVAYNVVLPGATRKEALGMAKSLRQSAGGMHGVQALAFQLQDGVMQLSMNLFDLSAAAPHDVLQEIQRLLSERGLERGDEEIVGLCPAAVAPRAADGLVLECRIAAAAARSAAAACRARGDDERLRLAARLDEAAQRLAATPATVEPMLRSAEESIALRRVLSAAGCLEPDVDEMLGFAGRSLYEAVLLAPPDPSLQARLQAFSRWNGGDPAPRPGRA